MASRVFSLRFACSALAIAAVAAPVYAQTNPPQSVEPATSSDGIGDIVVTAQRRSQNLQDVPIAITAKSAEALVRAGVQGTLELPRIVPGLTISQIRGTAIPYIRGVGTENDVAGSESGVAVYVDNVYIPSSSGIIFSFNNIERIEALKGPQGTLFGRNSTGGLLHVITREPSSKPTFMADVSYASYRDVTANAYVSGPIAGDTVRADLAVHYRDQGEGFGTNLTVGGDANKRNDYGFRSKVLISPGTGTNITLAGDYYRLKTDMGNARVPLPGAIGFGGATFKGKYNPQTNFAPFLDSESYGGSVRIVQDVGFGSLTSLTAYRKVNTDSRLDQDGTPVPVIDAAIVERFDTFQQELLLQGNSGALDWTTGLFYFWSSAGFNPLTIRSALIPPQNFNRFSNVKTNSYSAFAQGTYALAASTNLTLGARYTSDRRVASGSDIAIAGNPLAVGTVTQSTATDTVPDTQTNSKLTWRVALDQKFSEDILAYVSWNRGFKSGLFNGANLYQGAVQPEVLDAYSAGVKSEFLDKQVRLNVETFYYEYKGIQLIAIDAGISRIFNATAGRIYGLEAELALAPRLPTGKLDLSFGLSMLRTKYGSFTNAPFSSQNPNPPFANITFVGDATGNEMIRAPRFTLSTQLNYAHPIGSNEIAFSASWYHNGGFFFNVQNSLRQSAYDLVGGEISYAFANKSVRIKAFAKNLLDEDYLIQGDSTNALGSQGAYGDPRTFGGGISISF